MTWRGSTTVQDRLLSVLPYAYPVLEVGILGMFLAIQLPIIAPILLPLISLSARYLAFSSALGGFMGFIIFFALYMLVVRNENVNHLIRFNTMQAILLGISASLLMLVFQLIGFPLNALATASTSVNSTLGLLISTVATVIFLGVLASAIYSVIFSLQGKYGEIPVVSEAAYTQVRY